MSLSGIWQYLSRALWFALAVAAVYVPMRLARLNLRIARPRREALFLLLVIYLAALVEIIALRGRVRWAPGAAEVQWLPLRTTIAQWRAGPWPFCYHVLGNVGWFAPLGILLSALWSRLGAGRAVLAGLVLSLLLETGQWLLDSGMPDIDDVLLNAAGAWAGRSLWALARRRRAKGA